MLFPIWIIWIFPITWIVIIPGNLAIDIIVMILAMKFMNLPNKGANLKVSFLPVWLIGFLADIIGTVFMFLGTMSFAPDISWNPFADGLALLWVLVCVGISGFMIYFLNYRISFKRTSLDDTQKKKLALALAIFTAPYLFLLPTNLFY